MTLVIINNRKTDQDHKHGNYCLVVELFFCENISFQVQDQVKVGLLRAVLPLARRIKIKNMAIPLATVDCYVFAQIEPSDFLFLR